MKKITTKKTRSVNNKPNSLKRTKGIQKVNLQTTIINGEKVLTSAREARTAKKNK